MAHAMLFNIRGFARTNHFMKQRRAPFARAALSNADSSTLVYLMNVRSSETVFVLVVPLSHFTA